MRILWPRVQVEPYPGGFNLLERGCHVASLTRTEAIDLHHLLAQRLTLPVPFIARPPLWMRLRDWWHARFPSKGRMQSIEAGRARAQRLMDAGQQPHLRVAP